MYNTAMMRTSSHFPALSLGHSRQESSLVKRSSNVVNHLGRLSEDPEAQFITSRVEHIRPKPRVVYKDAESSDGDGEDEFTASPAEDIPRNRLVEKLVRGL